MEGNRYPEHEENQLQVKQISLNDKSTSELSRVHEYESPGHVPGEARMASSTDDNNDPHGVIESLPSTCHPSPKVLHKRTEDKEPVKYYDDDNEIVSVSFKTKNGDSLKKEDGGLFSKENEKDLDDPQSPLYVDIPLKDASNVKVTHLTDKQLSSKSTEIRGNPRTAADAGDRDGSHLGEVSDNREDVSQTSPETKGATSKLTKECVSKDAPDIRYTSGSVVSKLPNPFLLGPHLPFPALPHVGNPQRPVLMLPHVPQPFLMLPHQMAHAQWPFLPLPGGPQKISEDNFVRFSALNMTAAQNQIGGAIQEKNIGEGKKVKKKQPMKKLKEKTLEDTHNPDEEGSEVRYKTEYRKTNRASTMLICDKIKLPHKKRRKFPNLVDVSEAPIAAGSKSEGIRPIVEYVVKKKVQENPPVNLTVKPAMPKKKGTSPKSKATSPKSKATSPKSKAGKKGKGKRKVTRGKKSKLGNVGVKTKKVDGRKLKPVDPQELKKFLDEKQSGSQSISSKQKPKRKKQLTPEKLLYNKLTEVVKQIAEPNVFSPLVLPPGLEIKCSTCDITYPDRKSLWDHIQCHLRKPVPFRLSKYYRFCRVCRKYVSEIRDHIRACHFDGGTPYECPQCHERFRYKGLLRNHAQNRHTTARNYMCEMCGLAFKQSVTLRKHMLVHSDQKNFFCTTCGKAFKTMYALQKHNVVHALVKPYRCEVCNKEFTQQTNMKSHMRTHTGEKPYKCDLCNMAFTHNVSLKTHKKKHHGIDMWNPKNSQPTCQPGEPTIQPADTMNMWNPKNSQPTSQPDSKPQPADIPSDQPSDLAKEK